MGWKLYGAPAAIAGAVAGATAAQAQTAAGGQREPAEAYTLVPASERLTFAGVFADASPEVQVVMTLLVLAALGSVIVWGMGLAKVGRADAKALSRALGRLKLVRSAGLSLGMLGASYILFLSFIATANVRPAPSLTVMAPGFAEAACAVMLGLLASTVAVICERHLEAQVRTAAA